MTEGAMYCALCKTALMRIRSGGGSEGWQHSRKGYDTHKPLPVPVGQIENPDVVCDFCAGSVPAPYLFETAQLGARSRHVDYVSQRLGEYQTKHNAARVVKLHKGAGSTNYNYGVAWAACGACADLIDARDLSGLVSRVTESMPSNLRRTPRALAETRAKLFDAYRPLLAGVGQRVRVADVLSHNLAVQSDDETSHGG